MKINYCPRVWFVAMAVPRVPPAYFSPRIYERTFIRRDDAAAAAAARNVFTMETGERLSWDGFPPGGVDCWPTRTARNPLEKSYTRPERPGHNIIAVSAINRDSLISLREMFYFVFLFFSSSSSSS